MEKRHGFVPLFSPGRKGAIFQKNAAKNDKNQHFLLTEKTVDGIIQICAFVIFITNEKGTKMRGKPVGFPIKTVTMTRCAQRKGLGGRVGANPVDEPFRWA